MKRKEAEWGKPLGPEDLSEISKRLARIQEEGVQYESMQLDHETIILQFKFPASWSCEQAKLVTTMVMHLKKKLPENCFALVTTEDLKLKVHRPGDPSDALREANNILERRITKIEKQLMEHYEYIDQLLHRVEPPTMHQHRKEEFDDDEFKALQPRMEIKK